MFGNMLPLGIALSLQDDFTGPAGAATNAMQRLESTAQSTARGTSTAMQQMEKDMVHTMINLRNVMVAGLSFDQVGRDVQSVGMVIVRSFKDAFKGVIKVGAEFETTRASMKSFTKDATELDTVMNKIVQTAKETPFEIRNLANATRSLLALRADPFKKWTGANGENKELIKYIGDLGAFNPAQGVEGALFAYREALSGQMRSLKTRFDVNPELILGRKLDNSSVENFNKDFVEFVSKLAPNLMENLYGTWNQVTSNMADSWTQFVWYIAEDGGVLQAAKNTINSLADSLSKLTYGTDYKALGKVFEALWAPVDRVAKGVMNMALKVSEFSKLHPELARTLATFAGYAGVFFVLTGTMLRLSGSFIMAATAVSFLYANMQIMKAAQTAVTAGSAAATLNMRSLSFAMLAAGLTSYGLYYAYTRNVGGMRDATTDFVDKYLGGMEKLKTAAGVIGTVLFGRNDGNYAWFSGDQWNMIQKNELVGFAQKAVIARQRIGEFARGVAQGLGEASIYVRTFGKALLGLFGIDLTGIGKFLSGDFTEQDKDYWEAQIKHFHELGVKLGKIVGTIAAMKTIATVAKLISSPFVALNNTLMKTQGFFGRMKQDMQSIRLGAKNPAWKNLLHGITPFRGRFDRMMETYRERSFTNPDGSIHPAYQDHVLRQGATQGARNKWLGSRYYGADGRAIGKFGGLLGINRDGTQLEQGWMRTHYTAGTDPHWLGVSPKDKDFNKTKHRELGWAARRYSPWDVGNMTTAQLHKYVGQGLLKKAGMGWAYDQKAAGKPSDMRLLKTNSAKALLGHLGDSKYARGLLADNGMLYSRMGAIRGMGAGSPAWQSLMNVFGNKRDVFQQYTDKDGISRERRIGQHDLNSGAFTEKKDLLRNRARIGMMGLYARTTSSVRQGQFGQNHPLLANAMMRTGRIGGAVGKGAMAVGSGIGKVAGGGLKLARGAAGLGLGMLGMLPQVAMIGALLGGGWNMLSNATGSQGQSVTGAKGAAINLKKMTEGLDLKAAGKSLMEGIAIIMPGVAGLFMKLFLEIKQNGGAILSDMFHKLKNVFLTSLSGAMTWLKTGGAEAIGQWAANGAIALTKGLLGVITWFTVGGGGQQLVGFLGTLAAGIGKAILSMVTIIFNTMYANMPQWLKDAVDVLRGQKEGKKSEKLKSEFAFGGYANSPSIFGEAGPEMAIPLKRSARSYALLDQTARALGATTGGGGMTIENVQIDVHAGRLSQQEARQQALMIMNEFKKLGKEQGLRNYQLIPG